MRRKTAGDYLRGAEIALRRPGGWGRHSPSKAAIEVIIGFLAKEPGCGPASSREFYRELIALEVEHDRNAKGIWQDLVDSYGFAGGYAPNPLLQERDPPIHVCSKVISKSPFCKTVPMQPLTE